MAEVKNNPAGRLYDILREACGKNDQETSRKVWSEVFKLEPQNTSELLKMLADLIDLVHDTKAALERLENIDHELHKKPFRNIEKAFSNLNLDKQWQTSRSHLDEATLVGLQYSADLLSRSSSYSSITSEDIDSILSDLERLSKNVIDSDIPTPLKVLLTKNLESIRRSILAYKITGLEGIEHEIERGLGSLLLHKEEIQNSRRNSAGGDVWSGYFNVLERLHKIVAFARDAKELVGPTLVLLGFDGK